MNTQENLCGEKEPTEQSSPTRGLGCCCDLPWEMGTAWGKTTNTEHVTCSTPWSCEGCQELHTKAGRCHISPSLTTCPSSDHTLLPLFPVCLFCFDPQLLTEVTSALQLYILQRPLFIINWYPVITVFKLIQISFHPFWWKTGSY